MADLGCPRLAEGFVSGLLAARMADPTLPTRLQSMHGIVLFVDIAESTSMTDRVSALGPEGAERLGGFLNAYFTELIGIVATHGGDIIRIDGDALIAFWNLSDSPVSPAPLAARAATAVSELRISWPVEKPEPLQHRITLVTGCFETQILFNSGRRKFLVFGGQPLKTVGQIMRSGVPGDIILDEGMARLLAAAATIETVSAGTGATQPAFRMAGLHPTAAGPIPAFPSPAKSAIRHGDRAKAFVPRIVLERTSLGLPAGLAEFRTVTIAYVQLGVSDLSGSETADQLQDRFTIVADAADAMGVELFDVVADEKGVIAQIAMGLPPFDSEGHAMRAVEVARRIRDGLATRGAPCPIGIATGRVFCGDVGNALRREYVFRGSVMNYGARLMQAAGSGILCDDATMRAATNRFEFVALGEIAIRGRTDPLRVYRLVDARTPDPGPGYASPLLGRGREFAVLSESLDRLSHGAGGLLAIQSEPGSGKSRLLAELATAARQRGFTAIMTSADSIERMTAYFIFRAVILQLLARFADQSDAPLSHAGDQLATALAGTTLLPRMALMEDVVPLGIRDDGLAAQIRGAARRDGIADIAVMLCGRVAAQQPVVLLFDDVQWVDALSADLLLAVTTRLPHVLIVAASRPADQATAPHGSRVLRRAGTNLSLERLDPHSTTAMIRDILKIPSVPNRLAEFVYAQSEGLPIHVEQLVLALRERGKIEMEGGQVRLLADTLSTDSIPVKLREIIVSRIDRLEQPDQLMLRVASIIGRAFDLDTVKAAYPIPIDEAALLASGGRLAAAGLLTQEGAAFTFSHVIIQETTYDLLSFAHRRNLHQAIAEQIEQRHATTLSQHLAELAHHWEHAEDPEKALRYRLLAADLSIQRYANHDALMHAERAERLAERAQLELGAVRAAQLAYVRGEAHHGLSRFTEAEQSFQAFLDFSGYNRPTNRLHLALSAARQLAVQALHRMGINPRPSLGEGEDRARLFAHLHTRFAEHAYFMRDSLALLHGSLTALNSAESVQSYPEMIEGYGGLAIGLGTAGLHPIARFYRKRCIDVAESCGKLPDQAFANLLAGVYSYQAGDWPAAQHYCTMGVVLCDRIGDHFRRQSCLVVRSFGQIATGEYAEAEATFIQFGADADLIDNAPVRAWVLAGWSVLDMLRGQPPERAAKRLEIARAASLHRAERLLCDGLHSAALMQYGDTEAATSLAMQALADMEDGVTSMGIAMYSVCAVADVFLTIAEREATDRRQRERLRVTAGRACKAVARYAARTCICGPRAMLLNGRLAQLKGRRRHAERLISRALATAERLGMPLEQAEAHRALAAHHGPEARALGHAERAASLMQRLGAAPWRYGKTAFTPDT